MRKSITNTLSFRHCSHGPWPVNAPELIGLVRHPGSPAEAGPAVPQEGKLWRFATGRGTGSAHELIPTIGLGSATGHGTGTVLPAVSRQEIYTVPR